MKKSIVIIGSVVGVAALVGSIYYLTKKKKVSNSNVLNNKNLTQQYSDYFFTNNIDYMIHRSKKNNLKKDRVFLALNKTDKEGKPMYQEILNPDNNYLYQIELSKQGT